MTTESQSGAADQPENEFRPELIAETIPEIQSSAASNVTMPQQSQLQLSFDWQGHEALRLVTSPSASVKDVAMALSDMTRVDLAHMNIWVNKAKRLKDPFPEIPIGELVNGKTQLRFIGTPSSQIPDRQRAEPSRPIIPKATANRMRDWRRVREESEYTFHDIQPLPYLPNPEKSKRFLQRLADDPGIRASMRKHQFSVGLLTEMDPSQHTSQDIGGGVSRTLGLNRNRGEVIELRLRTDRYDGYRDYKVIRTTLCHELAHNVYGEHDRSFYNLMKEIQQDVDRGDWKHGGHRLTNEEFYNPEDSVDADHVDEGGYTGGEFVLGTLEGASQNVGLSRREILAKAAMSRLEKQNKASKHNKES